MLIGVSKAMDCMIFDKISDPFKCTQYNGKYGEPGIKSNTEMSLGWMQLLRTYNSTITIEQFTLFCEKGAQESPNEDFGFNKWLMCVNGMEVEGLVREKGEEWIKVYRETVGKGRKYWLESLLKAENQL